MAYQKVTTEVYCTLEVEGVHCWPECPLEEVAYLRDPHRHVFHIKAFANVSHDDRDIEFIVLKHKILNWFYDGWFDSKLRLFNFGPMSCEMIAKRLIDEFDLSRCEVSEDGENGAIVSVENVYPPIG